MPSIVERSGWLSRLSRPQLQLGVSPNKSYLVNGSGAPFQIRGDAAWCIANILNPSEVDSYCAQRASFGFNAMLMESGDSGLFGGPNNYNGDPIFTSGLIASPNNAYFNHLDLIFQTTARYGIVCFVVVLYNGALSGGLHPEGWFDPVTSQAPPDGVASATTYAKFLGNRYKNQPNIVWVQGGDFRPSSSALGDALFGGINGQGAGQLWTAHWARGSYGTDAGAVAWPSVSSNYTDQGDISSRGQTAFGAVPPAPFPLLESRYAGTLSGQPTLTNADLRQEAWHAYLSGHCGYFYGHHTVWQFATGWQTALAHATAAHMSALHSFMRGVQWQLLVPDFGATLVTSSRGTIGTTGYIVAALASDTSFAVVYNPAGTAITVDLNKLGGASVRGTWVDPTNNSVRVAATGSPFTHTSHTFTASSEVGNNADGGADWVLLLEAF